jgi:hypothetical protein
MMNINNGKVVIGNVTSPGSYKLYVGGAILAERVKIALSSSADWADYVFAPGYELLSLDSVFDYIHANCHLPGVPSAEEMVDEGLDVSKMNAKLLEKIEELTLYLVALSEQNKDIRADIELLKKQLK